MTWIFIDCEADGPCPSTGVLTEFGAVEYESERTYHGQIYQAEPDPDNPAISRRTGVLINPPDVVFQDFDEWLTEVCGKDRPVMWSDNPAFDFMWMCDGFWTTLGRCPLGHSARRISDFYAGLTGNVRNSQHWKSLRITKHDHNPVHDALGNVEAMKRILSGER